ncbi:MAG: hypothetical protein IJH81_03200 [Lachnospiraceae bacterium]|nr:hypothetical protein [Lachnospiraceae bacterium]MBQ6364422.1 hypothetical protein [Lachnospiraceae bacterium]MBQ6635360.1 hypothetical protein [Lachnospiraceae bacterium]
MKTNAEKKEIVLDNNTMSPVNAEESYSEYIIPNVANAGKIASTSIEGIKNAEQGAREVALKANETIADANRVFEKQLENPNISDEVRINTNAAILENSRIAKENADEQRNFATNLVVMVLCFAGALLGIHLEKKNME